MIDGLNYNNSSNNLEKVKDVSSEVVNNTKNLEISETESIDFNEFVEASDIELSNDVDDMSDYDISEEDLELLIGTMTQEEYDQFINGIEEYYDYQKEYLEGMLRTEDGEGYQDVLDKVNSVIALMTNSYSGMAYNYDDQIAKALEPLKKYGINDVSEAYAFQQEMQAHVNQINDAIKMTENVRESTKYDYMAYLSDYENYNEKRISNSELNDIDKYIDKGYTGGRWREEYGNIEMKFSYSDYVKEHPNINPAEFVQMIEEKYAGKDYTIDGISNIEELKTLAILKDKVPELLKKYNYLYNESPKKAEQYLKDCEYELNNFRGQIKAKEFLDTLATVDGKDKLDEIIFNEFGVHVEGLADGLKQFGEGVGYSLEAISTLLGISEENRTMSSSEYERMYILQALLSKEDKIKLGVLNKDGSNANNTLIDFSKEYTGPFLSNNYEISQGIGNMLPSIAISMFNPMAGSIALGVSSGGNAYHGAMVEGNDFIQSLGYGIFVGSSEAITERLLGGLPGLSDVEVTGLKTYLQSMGKEATQEMIQGLFDEVYQWTIMGKELPQDEEGWKEFAANIGKQGLYGAITAGYLQVPNVITGTINTKSFQNYIEQHNVNINDINEAINSIKDNDLKLANLSNEEIIVKHGKNLKTILNNILIKKTIEKYGCSIEVAMVIVDQGLNEEQINYLIDKLKLEQEKNYINLNELDANLEVILSNIEGEEVDVPDSYLEKYNIKLNKGEKICYNKKEGKFYRVSKKGIKDRISIPNSYINDPINNASDRLVQISSKGKNVYFDPVTGRRFPENTIVSEGSQGYTHVFSGEFEYTKEGELISSKGGHYAATLEELGYVVRKNPDIEVADNGVYWGDWYKSTDPKSIKESTFFPDSWSQEDVCNAIEKVGATKPILINPTKGLSVHYGTVNGVEIIIVDKRNNGEFGSAYPLYPGKDVEDIVKALTDTTREHSKGYIDVR